ncbi:hypothetical protein [Leucothrix arctica]|uniref:Uncharacterized protein n=1 Tax=Leucothrix arctica TaxID=1481894 RepID=A0A317CH85_9GAMM|nr:hypothetical protein [Leucothrix arctica]PWQ97767.1 hypothetical protein DKT75_05745 [Leucothrix arctica]
MKTISSSLTCFFKYYLFPLWTLAVLGLYLMLKDNENFELEGVHFFVVWLLVNIPIFWHTFTLKKVSIDDKQLYVSGYRSTEVILFSDIEYVSGSRFAFPEEVWFRTIDKKTIVFMPKVRFSIFQFQKHPMVEELADKFGLDDW